MEKVIVFLSVGLQVFCQKLKAAQYPFFVLKPQGNNRQRKVWSVWYIWKELQ